VWSSLVSITILAFKEGMISICDVKPCKLPPCERKFPLRQGLNHLMLCVRVERERERERGSVWCVCKYTCGESDNHMGLINRTHISVCIIIVTHIHTHTHTNTHTHTHTPSQRITIHRTKQRKRELWFKCLQEGCEANELCSIRQFPCAFVRNQPIWCE